MSTTITAEDEQDIILHTLRLISDPGYAQWQEIFRYHWNKANWRQASGSIPFAFIQQCYDAGYRPDAAFTMFQIADAEAYARQKEVEEVQQ